MSVPHVLAVDDDPIIRQLIADYLGENELRVTAIADGAAMRKVIGEEVVDLVVLDLKLKSEDGMALARGLRDESAIPIIMLTGRSEEADRVMGLELGADDYLTKPFSPRELAARIKALLRRRAPQLSGDVVEVEGLRLDPSTKKVSAGGRRLELSPAEFRLLHFLMTHPGRVYARAQLLDLVWGDHVFIEERTVDVHIRRLRKALEPSGHDRLIDTVRGSGYGLRTG